MIQSTPSDHNPQDATQFQKTHIRSKLREQRSQLSTQHQQQASHVIFQQLVAHPHINAVNCIAAYLPTQGEIDLTPFIHWAWQKGKRIALPVIHPTQAGDMRFHQYFFEDQAPEDTSPERQLRVNRYGILEPNPNCSPCLDDELDWVLTPLVAFDNQGTRLGMGGGYYDRFYARHRASLPETGYSTAHSIRSPEASAQNSEQGAARISFIGVAYDFQQVEVLPKAPWDMVLTDVLVA